MATAVARTQVRECGNHKPLKMKGMTVEMAVDKENLVRLQEEDCTLQRFKEAKEAETRGGKIIFYDRSGIFAQTVPQTFL